jgi:hypothetical protein
VRPERGNLFIVAGTLVAIAGLTTLTPEARSDDVKPVKEAATQSAKAGHGAFRDAGSGSAMAFIALGS